MRLLDIAHEGDTWTASEHWTTKSMQPAYNDFVIVDDVAYGFDKGIFCASTSNTANACGRPAATATARCCCSASRNCWWSSPRAAKWC